MVTGDSYSHFKLDDKIATLRHGAVYENLIF